MPGMQNASIVLRFKFYLLVGAIGKKEPFI
ncbi:MAG: hypothetical protein JWR61_1939 [Ferruginibacter sp.]|jgi:hypothetical protein|nr:hypothetical protein [Ferruginibacter sp.]